MAKSWGQMSIKWKLFFYIALFAAVMLAVLWLFQIVFLDQFYKSIKMGQIRSIADTLAQNIDEDGLQELVTRLAQGENICIIVTDGDGRHLYSENTLFDCVIHRMPPEGLARLRLAADESGGNYLETLLPQKMMPEPEGRLDHFRGRIPPERSEPYESLIYVSKVATKEGENRYLMLNSRISPVASTTETLRIQLFYISGILALLAFALALFISKRIAKPVMDTNEAAKRLARGEYDVRFEGSGYREIEQLSSTLNHAAYELSQVEELRRELIANVSHDLRTPLTMIAGYAEAIRDLPGEDTGENAQIILDEAGRLTRLVGDLLDLSRIQSGARELQITRFSVTDVLRENIDRIMHLPGLDSTSIVLEAEEEAFVEADEVQISQVVYNLLANAITHTAPGTSITVRQQVEGAAVTVGVVDQGEGIPEKDLSHIWERYYRGKTHTRAQVGNGLGLSIVRAVLTRHGARYGAVSRQGEGSTFWFALPLSKQ